MSLISRFPRSTRKQTTVFLLASLVTACVMLGSGTLKGQDPLQKYGDISALPMEKRRDAFVNASAKEKSDLFSTHLALYLARHPKLNEAQKAIILEGMSLATPEL